MIIDYDHNPGLTFDQKLQSLKESVQMALNEIGSDSVTVIYRQGGGSSAVTTGGRTAELPVGSVYESVNNVNPSAYFGGTWQALNTGNCLVADSAATPTYKWVRTA